MRKGELDFLGEIVRIPDLEKDQVIVAEIVLNAPCFRGNHWFRERQVFEDARGRIDFSEEVAVVRDNPEVATLDCLDDLFEIASAEIIDISVESSLPGRFHHFLEEACSLTANTQPGRWNCFPHLLQ
jgi:hypothetical protein